MRQLAIDRILVLVPSAAAWCTARLLSSHRLVLSFISFLFRKSIASAAATTATAISPFVHVFSQPPRSCSCSCSFPHLSSLSLSLLFIYKCNGGYLHRDHVIVFVVRRTAHARTHTHRLTGSSQSSFLWQQQQQQLFFNVTRLPGRRHKIAYWFHDITQLLAASWSHIHTASCSLADVLSLYNRVRKKIESKYCAAPYSSSSSSSSFSLREFRPYVSSLPFPSLPCWDFTGLYYFWCQSSSPQTVLCCYT